jgi:hypothetical protein
MLMRRVAFIAVIMLCALVSPLRAQQPADETVVELKALVFVLQTRLADVERELGEEKKRRAELESAELKRARETLDPAVKRKLGLPVPDAPKPDKPVPPQTPPK